MNKTPGGGTNWDRAKWRCDKVPILGMEDGIGEKVLLEEVDRVDVVVLSFVGLCGVFAVECLDIDGCKSAG
jgi:hypothetical protein